MESGGLRIVNYGAAASNLYIAVNTNGTATAVLRILGMAAGSTYVDLGLFCFNPGDVLYGQASQVNSIAGTMMGSLLDGAPL